MRSATRDYQMRGRNIAEVDWLWLAYLSGNRDEEVFEDPRLDPARTNRCKARSCQAV
jgi:hypothetical protein